MTPLFSIIIPHRNIPDLLMRCLRSIPISEDIQVIVVDDNSPDADTYLEKYPELSRPYLEFIPTTKGGGAGYARNVGLEHATGKWLMFADADDFFAENMQDIIFSHADSEADIVFLRKKNVSSSNIHHVLTDQVYLDRIMDKFIQDGDEWPLRTTFYVPYAKMIKRELIEEENIYFDEVMYANDCYFSVCAGYYAKGIEAFDEVIYFKTHRQGSLSDDFCQKPEELKIRAEVALRVDKFLSQHNVNIEKKIKAYLFRMLNNDKKLFRQYYNHHVKEVYPSKWSVCKDMCKDTSLKFKVCFISFTLLLHCSHRLNLAYNGLKKHLLQSWRMMPKPTGLL